MRRALLAVITLATLGGCFSRSEFPLAMPFVREQLQCPVEPVVIREIDFRTQGAIGCGRRAAFVMTCDYNPTGVLGTSVSPQCRWERDPPPPDANAVPPVVPVTQWSGGER